MTGQAVFEGLAPLLAPALEAVFERRDLCVLSTRIAIDVCEYFGVRAVATPTRMVVYNAAFAAHVDNRFEDVDVAHWKPVDGSHSVGVGFGTLDGKPPAPGRWDGHLIAVADGWFGDFSVGQCERPQHGILIGPAIVAPYFGAAAWRGEHSNGCVIEYQLTEDRTYRTAPDWRDKVRRRPIVGELIRALNAGRPVCV